MRPAKNPFHPGEILLEEFLKPAKITQAAFAEKIGWTRSRRIGRIRREFTMSDNEEGSMGSV
jgi:plasmid maintenance system antidote protein VapI